MPHVEVHICKWGIGHGYFEYGGPKYKKSLTGMRTFALVLDMVREPRPIITDLMPDFNTVNPIE